MDALKAVLGSFAGLLSVLLLPVVMACALGYIVLRAVTGLVLELAARLGGHGHPAGSRAHGR